jgi:hypothetical protein
MRRMTYPLTEKQKEIVDYSDGHGLEEAEARFGISHNQVRYLREKRNRIEREKNPGNSEAVQRPWPSPGSNAAKERSR